MSASSFLCRGVICGLPALKAVISLKLATHTSLLCCSRVVGVYVGGYDACHEGIRLLIHHLYHKNTYFHFYRTFHCPIKESGNTRYSFEFKLRLHLFLPFIFPLKMIKKECPEIVTSMIFSLNLLIIFKRLTVIKFCAEKCLSY